MNMALTIEELYRMFEFFNSRFFNSELEKPVILVQTNGRHKYTLGWCTTKKVWRDHQGSESYYEITICAEYLNRSIEEIIGTLLHEMVHLNNLQFGIKDTSRSGTYHNKKFKEVAEQKGLIIEYDKRIGWSLTKLKENTKAMIDELKPSKDLFKVARRNPYTLTTTSNNNEDNETEGAREMPKSSMRKYVCPTCGTIVRATKEVNIVCADCQETFIKENELQSNYI